VLTAECYLCDRAHRLAWRKKPTLWCGR